MDLILLSIFTLISAVAHQGANFIVYCAKTGIPVKNAPRWITTLGGFLFVKVYVYLATPIACLNGFLMYEYQGLIIAGVGTYLGTSIFRFLGRRGWSTFSVAITLIWTVINIFRFVGGFASAPDVPQFAEDALAATVYLEMTDAQVLPISYGSGFFVSQEHILTNYHVIAGAAHGTAKIVGKTRTYLIQGILAIDVENDLALLHVTIPGVNPLRLGDNDKVRIGDQVYVAGSPKGLEGTFSDGIISRISRWEGRERLQITAPISPGSSGGPVLNRKGKVIGVAFMTIEGGQNLNFAIPSKYVKALLNTKGTVTPLAEREHNISAETYYYRGNTKHDIGFYQNAISDYSKAIRLKPDFVEAYHNRGYTKAALGQYSEAITDYDIATKLEPNDAIIYYNCGVAKAALGQYPNALTDFDTTIKLESDFMEAYYNRAVVKGVLGQHSDALTDYNIAIKLEPDFVEAYHNRGSTKLELGKYSEAIADFDTVIKLKPDNVRSYNDRGVAKAELGKYFEAIADFNAAIQLKNKNAMSYHNRGKAKAELGKYSEAIADFNAAIQLNPNYAEAYSSRGVAKANLGQNRAAKQDLRTALRLATQAGDMELKSRIQEVLRLLE